MLNIKTIFLTATLVLPMCGLAADYQTPYGKWRGQTQYQAFIKGQSDPNAHLVTNLTIQIDAGGKLVGTSCSSLQSSQLSAQIICN